MKESNVIMYVTQNTLDVVIKCWLKIQSEI